MDKKRKRVSLTLFLLSTGIFLRVWGGGDKSLWLDEAVSFHYADPFHRGVLSVVKEVKEADAHPPFYYLLLHFWLKPLQIKHRREIIYSPNQVFSEGYLRFPSALLGIFSLVIFYFLVKGRKWGWIILIFSAFHIYYSQEARNYSLVFFFALLSLFALKRPHRIKWLLLTFSWIGGVYTYLYFFLFILAEDIWFLLFHRRKEFLFSLLLCHISLLIAFLPYLPVSVQRISSLPQIPLLVTPEYHLLSFFYVPVHLAFGEVLPFPEFYIFLLFLLLSSLIFLPFFKESRKEDWLYFITLFFPLFVSSLLPVKSHLFEAKHIIFSLPSLLLLLSKGIESLQKKLLPFFLSIFIFGNIVSYGFYRSPNFQKEDWKEAVNWVEEKGEKESIVLFDPDFIGYVFDFYYRGR
ncbi:hypothetical protein J7K43_07580, partial [Candidatus Calescamantes bacterium]|nr:hypothetical protein [Candidatus Calescamantes bacterium]